MSIYCDEDGYDGDPRHTELAALMSDISEEAYSAGWLTGLEYDLWQLIQAGTANWMGFYGLTDEQRDELRSLSAAIGGWIIWSDERPGGNLFVPLDQWLIRYNAYQEARI